MGEYKNDMVLESSNRPLTCVPVSPHEFFGNARCHVYSHAVWVARTQIGRVSCACEDTELEKLGEWS